MLIANIQIINKLIVVLTSFHSRTFKIEALPTLLHWNEYVNGIVSANN